MKNIEKFSEIQDHSAIYHLPHNDEHDLLIEIDNIQENNNRNFVQSNGEVPKEITNLLSIYTYILERMENKVCNICLDEGEELDDILQCEVCY